MIDVAIEAAKVAGKILLENFGKVPQRDIDKKGESDFVTEVDRKSQQAIVDHIQKRYPGHLFLAEEALDLGKEGDYRWVIDPLDGTTNYIHGYPVFSISIALEFKGEIILGVIYDPLREELFSAVKGEGAFLNGERIRVSDTKEMADCLLATGFPFRAKRYLRSYLECFSRLFEEVSGIRRAGSAALDLAYVACGRFDGFWELMLGSWDVAAGSLLIQEAGGIVSDFKGGSNYMKSGNIIATNRFIHEKLLEIVYSIFGKEV